MHIRVLLIISSLILFLACGQNDSTKQKEIISTLEAPPAIGPYSQGIQYGDLLFISGQIPIDPGTGEIQGENIEDQTRLVLDHIGAVLRAAGMDYGNVLQCSVFLTDLNDFPAMNAVYADYFPVDPPSRATVEVSRLPRDVLIEISAIAAR